MPLSIKSNAWRQDKWRHINSLNGLSGWDNEFGQYAEQVDAFGAGRMLVSNREFLSFIEDGGYRIPKWRTEEGWRRRECEQAEHPRFWRPAGPGTYRLRCMVEEIDMPWNWPVEVNHLEAKAFCNWKSAVSGRSLRLPTEAEWYRLRDSLIDTDQSYWPEAPGNINLEHYASPCPVTEFEIGFDWVCFFAPEVGVYFHNPFTVNRLRRLGPLPNWLCFFKSCPLSFPRKRESRVSDLELSASSFRPKAGDWLHSTSLRACPEPVERDKLVFSNSSRPPVPGHFGFQASA